MLIQNEFLESEFLGEHCGNKKRIVPQIPAPKSSRISVQTIKPFEPGTLNPARGLFDTPAVKIESRTDSEHYIDLQEWKIFRHEFLLFGST